MGIWEIGILIFEAETPTAVDTHNLLHWFQCRNVGIKQTIRRRADMPIMGMRSISLASEGQSRDILELIDLEYILQNRVIAEFGGKAEPTTDKIRFWRENVLDFDFILSVLFIYYILV